MGWAWLYFVLAVLVPAGGQDISAASHDAPATTAAADELLGPSRTHLPPFRLGDAAEPFGWSTIVGDFNRDGKPDVAVADHASHDTHGYRYRLEISNSGSAPQEVTFESGLDAITIGAADIDDDGDLDIIVSVPLSGQTLGVWLNDGHGQFTSAKIRRLPAAIRAVESLQTTDPLTGAAAFDAGPRRTEVGVAACISTQVSGSRGHAATLRTEPSLRSALLSSLISPRAPPPFSSDALS